MSLITRLQQDLTCVSIPWQPPNRDHARLINEIVRWRGVSDEDGKGLYTSAILSSTWMQ